MKYFFDVVYFKCMYKLKVLNVFIYILLNIHFSYSDRDRDSSVFTRVESSGFLTPSNDTITMKLIDKSLNWEARGSEVLTPS